MIFFKCPTDVANIEEAIVYCDEARLPVSFTFCKIGCDCAIPVEFYSWITQMFTRIKYNSNKHLMWSPIGNFFSIDDINVFVWAV